MCRPSGYEPVSGPGGCSPPGTVWYNRAHTLRRVRRSFPSIGVVYGTWAALGVVGSGVYVLNGVSEVSAH